MPAKLGQTPLGLRATEHTAAIAGRLSELHGITHAGFVVALELMGDASAVGTLRAWLSRAPPNEVWDIHHALVLLTGREPVVPLASNPRLEAKALREAWKSVDLSRAPEPRIEAVVERDHAEIAFELHQSSGRVGVEYDDPSPGSSWPRWSKSLRIAGHRLYDVGSRCGTCETCFQLVGWPEPIALAHAEAVRRALADVTRVDAALVEALRPLIHELRSGHCVVTLVDLDLEVVTDAAASWWVRPPHLAGPRDLGPRLGRRLEQSPPGAARPHRRSARHRDLTRRDAPRDRR